MLTKLALGIARLKFEVEGLLFFIESNYMCFYITADPTPVENAAHASPCIGHQRLIMTNLL